MPELRVVTTQQQNSVLTGSIIISGISYTGSNGGRIADTSIHSNTESNPFWMDDKASSHCLKTRDIHRAEHSKSMDNTSLIHEFRYIQPYDTDKYLPQSFTGLVRLTTQQILSIAELEIQLESIPVRGIKEHRSE